MTRWLVAVMCGLGWLVLAGAVAAPVVGMVQAAFDTGRITIDVVHVPRTPTLIFQSLTLAGVATVGAILLAVLPAGVLGSSPTSRVPWLLGLMLAPLVVPPQVYAYAWTLLPPGRWSQWAGGAVRAGAISAGWLWPAVSLILAAGWRTAGRTAYTLALLDASPRRSFLRAVIPSLRPHVVAAGALVAIITLIEYAIPHLTLCRVWATELLIMVDIGAPPGQIMRMALQPMVAVAVLLFLAAWSLRTCANWEALTGEDGTDTSAGRSIRYGRRTGIGWVVWGGAGIAWCASVAVPVGLMVANLRVAGTWKQAFTLFGEQWRTSLGAGAAVAGTGVLVALATILLAQASGRRWLGLGGLAAVLIATVPPAAIGIGMIVTYNRAGPLGDLYTDTPVVWVLSLTARYAAVAVLVAWLALGKRSVLAVDQARTDGAGAMAVLAHVLLPATWPSLLAGGLIMGALAVFEIVVTQLTGPIGYPSIAMTILNHMHYGRDDVVITTSLTVMASGVLLAQLCGWMLIRATRA